MTKAESNRKNALKSTGPNTLRGERYSRSNALKHGLYSRELLVSEADTPEFEGMRVGLKAQLKPSTMLQELAFDFLVCCCWRCKLALRLEHPQFARLFQDEQPENEQAEIPVDSVVKRWYGASPADIRAGARALEVARAEFERRGSFGEETKKFLMTGFGPHFVPLLEEWNTMSRDAILLADTLVSHAREFADVPEKDGESSSPPADKTKVVIDPMQGRHMVGKLLELQRNFLRDILMMRRLNLFVGEADATQNSDFNPRFLFDANRELRRALDWYFYLKDRGL